MNTFLGTYVFGHLCCALLVTGLAVWEHRQYRASHERLGWVDLVSYLWALFWAPALTVSFCLRESVGLATRDWIMWPCDELRRWRDERTDADGNDDRGEDGRTGRGHRLRRDDREARLP